MKTRAAVLVELGRPLEIAELEIPALREGQVLVEIAYSGVCHTQLSEVRGRRGEDAFLPHCLGHEASGTVVARGPGVTKVADGDAVVLSWIKGSGANVPGATYAWSGRTVNAGAVTTFSRHAVASENRVTAVPEGVAIRDAMMLGCALPTGVGAILNTAAAQPGTSVGVFGVGGVGACALAGAVAAGCAPVVGVDPNPLKRELARRLGAQHVIDPNAADPVAEIRRICGGLDVAIEAAGVPSVMQAAFESVRARGGRAVVIGNAPHGEMLAVDPRWLNDGKSLLGCWGGDAFPDRDVPRFGALVRDGRIDVSALLSEPYALDDVNRAIDDLEAGLIGRPLLDLSIV
jgi:S-(hydroxymethyl)glutathione dehydrogenase / alcohol dehydrogenase